MVKKEGRFFIGIGAIIEHIPTGKILLLRRSSNVEFAADIWDDVGGRMRDFETPEETLRREVFEEMDYKKSQSLSLLMFLIITVGRKKLRIK